MKWRIWYSDGSVVSSDDCAPADVPGWGVQAIAQPDMREHPGMHSVSWVVVSNYDWYYYRTDAGEWRGAVGDVSMWEFILDREPVVGVCKGQYINHKDYNTIVASAKQWAEEQGLPPKQGTLPGEWRE